jgi:hypothetical protein
MPLTPDEPVSKEILVPTEREGTRYEMVEYSFARSGPTAQDWSARIVVALCESDGQGGWVELSRETHAILPTDLMPILGIEGVEGLPRAVDLDRAFLQQLVTQGSLPPGTVS